MFVEAYGTCRLVTIVKNDGDASLGDTCLTALVYKILEHRQRLCYAPVLRSAHLQVLRPNYSQVVYAEYKTYRIENVGLSGAVESRDRVEAVIPSRCEL